MRSNSFRRLFLAAAFVLLAGCAGGASPLGGTPSVPLAREQSAPASATPSKLIFIGTYNDNAVGQVDVFDATTLKFIKQFGHVQVPAALTTDTAGNLYEADSSLQEIQVFEPPYARPARALKDTGYIPSGVHVDAGGNLYVANFCVAAHFNCSGPGNVIEFPAGSSTSAALSGGPASPFDVTTDANRNVWSDGLDTKGNCVVGHWPNGKGTFVVDAIYCNDSNPGGNRPGGIRFDSKGNMLLAYAPNNTGIIGVFAPGQTTPRRSIEVTGDVLDFAFGNDESRLYVVDFNGFRIRMFSNPQGHLVGFVGKPVKAYSVATLPATLP
jgi:hypothetical protein